MDAQCFAQKDAIFVVTMQIAERSQHRVGALGMLAIYLNFLQYFKYTCGFIFKCFMSAQSMTKSTKLPETKFTFYVLN